MSGYSVKSAHFHSDTIGPGVPVYRWRLEIRTPDETVMRWTGNSPSYGHLRRRMRRFVRQSVPRSERRALYRRLP